MKASVTTRTLLRRLAPSLGAVAIVLALGGADSAVAQTKNGAGSSASSPKPPTIDAALAASTGGNEGVGTLPIVIGEEDPVAVLPRRAALPGTGRGSGFFLLGPVDTVLSSVASSAGSGYGKLSTGRTGAAKLTLAGALTVALDEDQLDPYGTQIGYSIAPQFLGGVFRICVDGVCVQAGVVSQVGDVSIPLHELIAAGLLDGSGLVFELWSPTLEYASLHLEYVPSRSGGRVIVTQ